MVRKGNAPSLLSGSAGKVEFVVAKKKRDCKRCSAVFLKGDTVIEVAKPGKGFAGKKAYCKNCFREVLEKTKTDLTKLEKIYLQLNT